MTLGPPQQKPPELGMGRGVCGPKDLTCQYQPKVVALGVDPDEDLVEGPSPVRE